MPIQLTSYEEDMLLSVLERYLPTLRIELANTDDREYRKYVKERKEFVEALVARLKK